MLIVLSGLPGVGKTTMARELARTLSAVHVRIDSIEQALRDAGVEVEAEGSRVTRDEWRAIAEKSGVPVLEVELVCGAAAEHRRRVESRAADFAGLQVPTWQQVLDRDYRPWTRPRLVIDTARLSVGASVETILSAIV